MFFTFIPSKHGFKKTEDNNWVYTKLYFRPSWFPILKKKDKNESYKFDKKYYMELSENCGISGSRWGIIIVPSLFLGTYYNSWFLLFILPSIALINHDKNEMHENIVKKLRKFGEKIDCQQGGKGVKSK